MTRYSTAFFTAVVVTGFTVSAPTAARAQAAQAPGAEVPSIQAAGSESDLLRAYEAWRLAFVAQDTAAVRRIAADDVVSVAVADAGLATVATKTQLLLGMTFGRVHYDAYAYDDVHVGLHRTVAVVTSRTHYTVTLGSQLVRAQHRVTDVFAWRDGRWQVVATHAVRVATPGGDAPSPARAGA